MQQEDHGPQFIGNLLQKGELGTRSKEPLFMFTVMNKTALWLLTKQWAKCSGYINW